MINEITHGISSLTTDPTLYQNRANAFRTANFLAQRQYYEYNGYPNDNEKEQKDAFWAQLSGLGLNATTIPDAITELKQILIAPMQENNIGYAAGVVQQWEDWAQFDGWTKDLQVLGNGTNHTLPPRTMPQQSRAAAQSRFDQQTAAGLVL